jgi:GntR family transcriptional regulator
MDDIRTQIGDGRLRPGDRLPSTPRLAAQYGVSPGTVRQAVSRLLEVGVLRGQPGLAVFVAGGPDLGA